MRKNTKFQGKTQMARTRLKKDAIPRGEERREETKTYAYEIELNVRSV